MAQPVIVKHTDEGPALTRPYNPANTTANNAIAEGDFAILSSGNLTVYSTDGTAVLGLALGYDTGSMLNGIVPTGALDLTGQYVNGAYGPTTSAIKRYVAVLSPNDIVRVDLKANQTPAVGDSVGITGATGAWVADTAAINKIAKVVAIETAATASATGVGLVRFPDASLQVGG